MKKLLLLIAVVMAMVSCNSDKTTVGDAFAIKMANCYDSITAANSHVVDSTLNSLKFAMKSDSCRIDVLTKAVLMLKDSISILKKRPILTDKIAAKAYSYDRLYDYYVRCVKNPVKWKYYKGWSIRVFKVNQ